MTVRFLPTVIEPRDHAVVIAGIPLSILFGTDRKTAKCVIDSSQPISEINPNTRKAPPAPDFMIGATIMSPSMK
jgi:hypothetical protein